MLGNMPSNYTENFEARMCFFFSVNFVSSTKNCDFYKIKNFEKRNTWRHCLRNESKNYLELYHRHQITFLICRTHFGNKKNEAIKKV
jgi:hypothetical protein